MQETALPVFRVSIIAIVLFQVAALFARSMLDLSLRQDGMDPDLANDLSYLVVPPILLVLMLPYLRRCKDSLRQLFAPYLLTARVVARSIALGLTLRLMWWASTTFLIGVGVLRNDDPNAIAGPIVGFDCPPPTILVSSLVIMAALVPITEETLHRGFLLHAALPYGKNVAVVVSAAVFALVHLTDAIVAAFAVGLAFAVQTLSYRSLWAPVVAHGTYNASATIDWNCFRLVWNPAATDPLLGILTWGSVAIMIAGVLLIYRLLRAEAAGEQVVAPRLG